MPNRLALANELFPVQALFNAIPAHEFVRTLAHFSEGIGVGFNDVSCEFSSNSEDHTYDGVKFWIFNEEVTLTNKRFLEILSIACEMQISLSPEELEEIHRLQHDIRIFLER